jgi:hypothetical protein
MRTSTGEPIKNRPIHELLYVDEEDQKYEQEGNYHRSSLSTSVLMETFQEESEEKEASAHHPTLGRKALVALLSIAVILAVVVTSVELIEMGPQLTGSYGASNINGNNLAEELEKLKAASTGRSMSV